MILKLEILKNETILERWDPPRYVWVPVPRLRCWYANGEYTTICVDGNGRWHVAISPDDLGAAIDPENACPDPPGQCGYYTHYLAYGGPDLTHAGFHAAVAIHERHSATCQVWKSDRACSLCLSGEQRIRA